MITRNQIISQARTWIGTPFHHQNKLKNVGCDCVGLIIEVANELNIGDFTGLLPVSYNFFQDRHYLLDCLDNYFAQCERQYGSIALIGSGDLGWHIGFVGRQENNFTLIHSCMKKGMVVEQRFFEGAFYFDFPNIVE